MWHQTIVTEIERRIDILRRGYKGLSWRRNPVLKLRIYRALRIYQEHLGETIKMRPLLDLPVNPWDVMAAQTISCLATPGFIDP